MRPASRRIAGSPPARRARRVVAAARRERDADSPPARRANSRNRGAGRVGARHGGRPAMPAAGTRPG